MTKLEELIELRLGGRALPAVSGGEAGGGMMTKLERLLELVRQLPEGLRSDWRGTNHFELTSPEGDYWWLDFREIEVDELRDCDDKLGERVGLVMDIAEAAKAAEEELGNVVLIKRRLREKHIAVDEAIAALGGGE